ncbi:hypothetical protein BJX62DRAFT_204163 [Aspergillus germanicus]
MGFRQIASARSQINISPTSDWPIMLLLTWILRRRRQRALCPSRMQLRRPTLLILLLVRISMQSSKTSSCRN